MLDVDVVIVICFLIINLAVGLYYGRGVRNIKQYAIGDRNFSTFTITATIVATWIAGSDFARTISGIYSGGILYFIAGIGDAVNLLVVSLIFAPRMNQFFGNLSVAEAMGNIYGTQIRIIVATSSIIITAGVVAIQIKVFAMLFSYLVGFSNIYTVFTSSIIVIAYSAFGGIRSVTFTDILQFTTFGLVIPIIVFFMWKIFGNTHSIIDTLKHPLFNYEQIVDLNSSKLWKYFFLFFCFAIPGMNPVMFQRILMSQNTRQIQISFFISALVALVIYIFTSIIGVLIFSYNSDLEANNLLVYVIHNYFTVGIRGVLILGVLAMVMSTADSYLNSGAVLFAHDICKPLNKTFSNELLISKIFSVILGIIAVLLTLSSDSILDLILLTDNFYMPVVTVPLVLAIFGFRTSKKIVMISITLAVTSVVLWKIFIQPITEIDSLIPGIFTNLTTILLLHYLIGSTNWKSKANN
ncbi:MAG: sodium:solute symporter family protein [Rickettsiaceae bacterium]|nr:sodium:solute symporter family protein [Rickettsiaceae bacterium]